MTFSGIALDSWAAGTALVNWTLFIVSLILLISCTLFSARLFQVYKENTDRAVPLSEKMLQICHLGAMFFSCFYIFLYEWNYIHIYIPHNPFNCTVWFVFIMISITMTKVFIYSFLMLRSSLVFWNSFFQIPLKLAIAIASISVLSQLTMMFLMLSDFTAFTPYPDKGLCFRTLGPVGTVGISGFNIVDAVSAVMALSIFWWKAKSVKKIIFSNNDAKLVIDSELNKVFNKHIKLGALIVMGSILIYLAGEFLTILMGVASALHQCFNNVYIFLLFKPNIKWYTVLCKCKASRDQSDDMFHLHPVSYDTGESQRNKDTTQTVVTHSEGIQTADIKSSEYNILEMTSTSVVSKSLSSLPRFHCVTASKGDQRSASCAQLELSIKNNKLNKKNNDKTIN